MDPLSECTKRNLWVCLKSAPCDWIWWHTDWLLHSHWYSCAPDGFLQLTLPAGPFFPSTTAILAKTVGLTQVFPVIPIKALLPSGHEESPCWSCARCFTGKWAKTQCFTIYFQWEPLSSLGRCRRNSSQAQLSGRRSCPSRLLAIRQQGKHGKLHNWASHGGSCYVNYARALRHAALCPVVMQPVKQSDT